MSGPVGAFNGMHERHAWNVRSSGKASSRTYPRPAQLVPGGGPRTEGREAMLEA